MFHDILKNFLELLKSAVRGFLFIRKSPAFWQKRSAVSSIIPDLLIPFSVIYYSIVCLRNRGVAPEKLAVPVICAGNLTVGGAGKTPLALKIAEEIGRLSQKKIAFVSRGYMGTNSGPLPVNPALHHVEDVGDEPLLLAKIAETWIGRDRLLTAKAAIAAGAGIIIMDDGFQNMAIHKDLSLIAVDGGFGTGNGLVLPAGPLREPVLKALKRADAVVFIGDDKYDELPFLTRYARIIKAKLQPVSGMDLAGKKVLAFAGIGRPEKFFETLVGMGAELLDKVSFPDHYVYEPEDIKELISRAAKLKAILITTEKDYVRLPADMRGEIKTLPVNLEIADMPVFQQFLQPYI